MWRAFRRVSTGFVPAGLHATAKLHAVSARRRGRLLRHGAGPKKGNADDFLNWGGGGRGGGRSDADAFHYASIAPMTCCRPPSLSSVLATQTTEVFEGSVRGLQTTDEKVSSAPEEQFSKRACAMQLQPQGMDRRPSRPADPQLDVDVLWNNSPIAGDMKSFRKNRPASALTTSRSTGSIDGRVLPSLVQKPDWSPTKRAPKVLHKGPYGSPRSPRGESVPQLSIPRGAALHCEEHSTANELDAGGHAQIPRQILWSVANCLHEATRRRLAAAGDTLTTMMTTAPNRPPTRWIPPRGGHPSPQPNKMAAKAPSAC